MARISGGVWLCLIVVMLHNANCQVDYRENIEGRFLFGLNDIADVIFDKLGKILYFIGYDPFLLPSYEASFLHIGFLGHLELNNSRIYNLTTIHRSNDVFYNRTRSIIRLSAPVKFNHLKMNATYEIKALGISKEGTAVLRLPNLEAEVDMTFDVLKLSAKLNKFQLMHKGYIDIHLEGGIIDKLTSIVTETVGNLFKNRILRRVGSTVQELMDSVLEEKSLFQSQLMKLSPEMIEDSHDNEIY